MSAPEIFLSYNRDDAARAKLFADALAADGFEVWWDAHLRSGEDYDTVTEQALKNARAVVVLWSPRSVDSRWVRAEATIAQRNHTLMPAMIEPCDRPVMFELTQTADLSHWHGNTGDPAWQAFVNDLRGMVGKAAPEPITAPPAETQAPAEKAKPDRRLIFGAIAAAVLALAGIGYFAGWYGGGTATRSEERIPVLVRGFEASGSDNPTETALASGITDELINRLRRLPELQIATAKSDGSAPSEAFSAAHVVEGSIRNNGDQLRVSVRLYKPDGEVLWSETFDRKLADIFEVQEAIAASIANTLSVSLDVGGNATSYGGTSNPEAYAAYVQAMAHQLDFDQSVPVRYFERAIALDPNYVQALASLSATYGNRITLASNKAAVEQMLAEMDATSAKALAAGPDSPQSNMVRGWYFVTIKQLEAAEELMQRASELDNGSSVNTRGGLAQYAVTMGRNAEALSFSRSLALIDPLFENFSNTAFMLMMNGRHREAIEMYERLAADDQQSLQSIYFHIFWAKVLAGDEAGAIAFVRGLNLPNLNLAVDQYSGFEQQHDLHRMDVQGLRTWANGNFGDGGQFAIANLGLVAAHRGHDRLAVDLMRVAFERPGGYALFYLWHPAMAHARKTPEFAQLVVDLGFPEAWKASGNWGDFCKPKTGGGISCS